MTQQQLLSSAEVCELTGATYRQLDTWARRGYVTPATPARGSGTQRRWAPAELEQVKRLALRSADLRRGLVGR